MKAFQLVVSWTGHVLPFLSKVCPELPYKKEAYCHAPNGHLYLHLDFMPNDMAVKSMLNIVMWFDISIRHGLYNSANFDRRGCSVQQI